MKIVLIARDGWLLERTKGRPLTNLIRVLLLTRGIATYGTWLKMGRCRIDRFD